MQDDYLKIRRYRDDQITQVAHSHFLLNHFHDEIITRVIFCSIKKIEAASGPLPCSFSFFMMGSAGRFEQSVWSDQDHGIIYQDNGIKSELYFLALGNEISSGLYQAGYAYCEGGVMASSPLWCKSFSDWQEQLENWIIDASWESIRNLLIFIDGRTLYGNESYLQILKQGAYQIIHQNHLLQRLLNNTMYLKKGIGVFGQILVETHGLHSGSLNIKETALFPYVNAIRLLAIKGKILETSTLVRLKLLPETWISTIKKSVYEEQFLKLVNLRLSYASMTNYEDGHYLSIQKLTKTERIEVKDILNNGTSLFRVARNLIEKEGTYGDE